MRFSGRSPKIGQTPAGKLDQFLPDVWARDDAAEPLPIP
jgi:hypothetical protein